MILSANVPGPTLNGILVRPHHRALLRSKVVGYRLGQAPVGSHPRFHPQVLKDYAFVLFDADTFMISLIEIISIEQEGYSPEGSFQGWSSSAGMVLEMLYVSVHEFPNSTRAMRSRFECRPPSLLRLRPERCGPSPLVRTARHTDESVWIRSDITP